MAFALSTSITRGAQFSRVADIAAIVRTGVSMPVPAKLGKTEALSRIRAQLASQRN